MSITRLTAAALGEKIKNRELSAREALQETFRQIDVVEKTVHAYITIDRDAALRRADEVQKQIDRKILTGPLAGVPAAIKDNLCTQGIRTTCGSKMLQNFVPTYSSEAVIQLENAGMVMIGKTNMDEFAMGSTTETSFFGVTRNPWNSACVPGGSSGGSCAAVAAGECFYAIGSDTGGSIRQPASHCGVTGIKPTYGTVSRYGLIAYASSFDQVGPIGKDVTDCVTILDAIASYDKKDSTSTGRKGRPFAQALDEDIRGMKIGIPRDYIDASLDEEVRNTVFLAADKLRSRGAVVEEFDLGLVPYVIPTYYTIASAQASSNLSRYDGVKYGYRTDDYKGLHDMYKKTRAQGFGSEVKRRIMLGSFVLSAGYYEDYYLKALKAKTMIKHAFDKAFADYDVIMGPAAPGTAPRIGTSLEDPMQMYLGDIYTVSANLAGLPGMTVPAGLDAGGLPIGVQFLADCFAEHKMIRAGYAFEQAGEFPTLQMKGGVPDGAKL